MPRGEPGGKEFYSHFGGRLGLDEAGRHYGADDEDLDAAIRFLKDSHVRVEVLKDASLD